MTDMPAVPSFLCRVARCARTFIAALLIAGPATAAFAADVPGGSPAPAAHAPQRILFVGDSLTHGRYAPVRSYGAMRAGSQGVAGTAQVVDENFGRTDARAEREPGPWGGIPGIFARLAVEAGLDYDVHLEAMSATSLAKHDRVASDVIDRPTWDAVVLQELSVKPLPFALTHSRASDPAGFCASVAKLARGIRAAAPQARVYLYETWPRADLAKALAGEPGSDGFHARYVERLADIVAAYRNAFDRARRTDPSIAAVAPVGRAWQRAWATGVADPDPYVRSGAPLLWYGMRARNDPPISRPDYLHPGVSGAYLSALVLFQQIAGVDVRTFGPREQAAAQLGIAPDLAARLQAVASDTVRGEQGEAEGDAGGSAGADVNAAADAGADADADADADATATAGRSDPCASP
ncbi:hypothetical protein [Burkholderia ambifaria]|jgi:hypothetical protein|uniref:hypothetical protein n=1 Tax=Burkholderia ambifaria TaxID=152480 RepID=UPI001B94ADBC|nr:hypothetical protein [Burkholderia ambifaria]MBR8222857.1 hypothetical protein [Burkholderia ambifaria]